MAQSDRSDKSDLSDPSDTPDATDPSKIGEMVGRTVRRLTTAAT